MPSFGETSTRRLEELDPRLQNVLRAAIVRGPDFTILEGFRPKDRQNEMVKKGLSKLSFPKSKHNQMPSLAVDIAPWPIDWPDYKRRENPEEEIKRLIENGDDLKRFHILAGYIFGQARLGGVPLRWGGDWDGDWKYTDQTFHDLPHFELNLT